MQGFFTRRKNAAAHAQLDALVERARTGDDEARSELLSAYTPFILRVASQTAKRFIHKEHDDEFSIAMTAMNEALDRFDPSKNASFLNFAETVIRRRLIDYFRSQQPNPSVAVWSEFDLQDEEDNVVNYAEIESAVSAHAKIVEQRDRRDEIVEFAKDLTRFGLEFSELVDLAPKHADARANAMAVAKLIAAEEQLREFVFRKNSLPLKELEERVTVSRKTLERQRKYIIAIVILLCGDYHYLQDYIQ
ncbi:RNA polymerase sigma factor SigI [Alicyclobacillus ferrooxydans]|uniref:RNA polymerase sigma factor SigI n=1 Tax=Alicyclobacillus ferrooxydans TaxID=471514 RepID=A0A0P9CZ36_9BACL|nr:RNA polymerase sigma factor SigI [Alicyclobacillus ferrooxydans]KPV42270.1 RNA polymerase subunit sigma [Alicyclobacillus ferrooxydans]